MKTFYGHKADELKPIPGYTYITTGAVLKAKDDNGRIYTVDCDPAKGAVLTPIKAKQQDLTKLTKEQLTVKAHELQPGINLPDGASKAELVKIVEGLR